MASPQTTPTVPGPGLSVPETPPREISIDVERLSKSYMIPTKKLDTLKERAVRPFERATYRRLQALDEVSFEVEQGEFFGIVGRNGSGKSTLLKLLASIYRADAGRIRIAGRVVPFIELGVGFNVELSARDNVVLNGVMMGLTPREARWRFDEVIEFAELEEFSELKLKNYSSGMLVRLGFSLMTQVDADVLLIDEVLAVGDAAFQQKSFDAFSRLHREGRTIVLVTHDMHTVEGHCDRAILLEEGRILEIGDAGDVARRYLELNFEHRRAEKESEDVRFRGGGDVAEFVDVRIVDESGATVTSIEARQPIRIEIEIEAKTRIERPMFGFQILDGDGLQIFAPDPWGLDTPLTDRALEPGERVHLRAEVANPLASGHYYVNCALGRLAGQMEMMAFRKHAADFVVYGAKPFGGLVAARLRDLDRGRGPAMSTADGARRPGTAELREITGPSALGGGARRFFDLLWLTSVTEFKLGYHGTALGFLWSFLRPLLLFGVLLLVFTQVFRFGDDVKNYPAMLLLQHHAVHVLRRRDRQRRDLGGAKRERGPQDAVPAARDPALGGDHERAPARAQPDRRLHLPDRLRRRAGLDLDPDPAADPRRSSS